MRAPILEFDPDPHALIDAARLHAPLEAMPARMLFCFFRDVIEALVEAGEAVPFHQLRSELGPHPIYRWASPWGELALMHPGVGAPLAVGLLEESIALGARLFITCGGAGSLMKEVPLGTPVIPLAALRDEGTSYHYMPPTRWVNPDAALVQALERTLEVHGHTYLLGKTWTTDALFRETAGKIARRREEGCITVEMEAAALFAVARFRRVRLAALLYAGDDLGGEQWDHRDWHRQREIRFEICRLAAEALAGAEGGM